MTWIKRLKKKLFEAPPEKGTMTVDAILIADTDDQVLVEIVDHQQWLPKSEIKIFEFSENQVIIIMPKNLLKKRPSTSSD